MKNKRRKITAVLTALLIAISCFATSAFAADDRYTASFEVTGGKADISIYYTQDTAAADETGVSTAYARNSSTGEIDISGDGQINFSVNPEAGYTVSDIAVSGEYKNLKTVSAEDNLFRITKVAGNLAVTVTLALSSDISEEDTVVTFGDSGAAVSGIKTGVNISGTDVSITSPGTYTLTGTCLNGSVVVKKNVSDVTLILDNLSLTASATAPITCNKGSSVEIIAKEGTVNTLTDDEYNNDDIYTDTALYPDIENAVIKCKDGSNVIISGKGTININSYGKNGIKGGYDLYEEDADGNVTDTLLSTASLTVKDVTLNINAEVNDGIKSDKELNLLSGKITVSAADDGIKSDYVLNIGSDGTEGPEITVSRANEGIEGAQINVYSGNISVTASNDGINAANSDLSNYGFSYNQYGGNVYVNCTAGDGIDSNGDIILKGGKLEVFGPSSGDGEPLDSDKGITLGGATVFAAGQNQMGLSISSNGTAYVTFGGAGNTMRGGMFSGSGTSLVTAGSTVSVKDSSGNTLYSGKAPGNAGYVLFSSSSLLSGSSYSLINGSSQAASATASASGSGGQPGGQPGTQPGGYRPGAGRPGESEMPGGGSIPGGGGNPGEAGTPGDADMPAENGQSGEDTASESGSFLRRIINFFSNIWQWLISIIRNLTSAI